jgi:DNA-binding transcriptional ArsR family regulator
LSKLIADSRSPEKGWVRDGILSLLAKGPGTASEIARELGVSKATVSYHTKALIRKDMIEIADVKSVRGGVYSKTYSLRRGALALARRHGEQEASLGMLDDSFERLLLRWHLEPRRSPGDEIAIFLYHLFRLLSMSDSLDRRTFEEYGSRVGGELIAPNLEFSSLREGLKELAEYLVDKDMAMASAESKKGRESKMVCMGCFENKEYGNLVCSFTQGILTGVVKARHRGSSLVRRDPDSGEQGCVYTVGTRGFGR